MKVCFQRGNIVTQQDRFQSVVLIVGGERHERNDN